jgi:hypothetical protein
MTFLVPLMMFGWILLTAALFRHMPAHRAVIVSVVGGVLFLPAAVYNIAPFPRYTKDVAIAASVFIGGFFCRPQDRKLLRLNVYDIPMLMWCFISPLATSLSNRLSLSYAFSSALTMYLGWGVVYWAGRKYFVDPSSLHELAQAIVIGGLLYVPLILFELRMSPKLSKIIYGFFPHSWLQHIRYGGWRPIVFMEHGLMVALWMSAAFTIAFWYWKTKTVSRVAGIPIGLAAVFLFVLALFTRSATAWIAVSLAIVSILLSSSFRSAAPFRLLLLAIPVYMIFRVGNVLTRESLVGLLSHVLDAERIGSFGIRLVQEELFGARALERPLFGWGHMGRAWPTDIDTGLRTIQMVDSLFTIILSTRGLFGLFAVYSAMLIGPWRVFGLFNRSRRVAPDTSAKIDLDATILGVVVVIAMLDSLMNGLLNPTFLLCSGALVTWFIAHRGCGSANDRWDAMHTVDSHSLGQG